MDVVGRLSGDAGEKVETLVGGVLDRDDLLERYQVEVKDVPEATEGDIRPVSTTMETGVDGYTTDEKEIISDHKKFEGML